MTLHFTNQSNSLLDTWTDRSHIPAIHSHVRLHDGLKYRVADTVMDAKEPGHVEIVLWDRVGKETEL